MYNDEELVRYVLRTGPDQLEKSMTMITLRSWPLYSLVKDNNSIWTGRLRLLEEDWNKTFFEENSAAKIVGDREDPRLSARAEGRL